MSIPKIIHYCWVGGKPKPQSVLYCIESWKRCCPDYEIIEWNETNYDFSKNKYMKEAYDAKKWGFVPDYARLDIVYEHGGIYLDTDVEMIKSFDELLCHKSFFGFEDTGEGSYFVACGLGFGAEKNNPLIKKLRDYYEGISFLNADGSLNLTPAPRHNTPIFEEYGVKADNKFQLVSDNAFYPAEYFCPKIFKTGKTKVTEKTFSIHHFTASWLDEAVKKEIDHNQKICLRFGNKFGHFILLFESVMKKYGLLRGVKKGLIKIYEKLLKYYPVIRGFFRTAFKKRRDETGVVLFDTGKESKNLGDLIIMENCENNLADVLDISNAVRISTHVEPQDADICRGKYKILCGTNILSCRMMNYGLWKLPKDVEKFGKVTLMGVGFDSYNMKSDLYTRLLLRLLLSKDTIHSVRDSFSEKALRSMGIKNVFNTGCPTMWKLSKEHCAEIPKDKGKNVVCTLTDYCRDEENDRAMLEILLESYEKVYLWLQGSEDYEYVQKLGFEKRVELVESTLEAYDEVLKKDDLDYVGTRLHAGIRALCKKHRSLIVAIDNRAECIHADTGLPIVKREEIKPLLKKKIFAPIETDIVLPRENISRWLGQFKGER